MASIPAVLRRIRRARREAEESSTADRFEQYEPEYRRALRAVKTAAGEDALDDVLEAVTEWTRAEGRLPTPAEFREHARTVLNERDVAVPPELQSST